MITMTSNDAMPDVGLTTDRANRLVGQLTRIPDSGRTLEFHGVEIAYVTTESPTLPRWTEMRLYKVTDGTGRYVLSVVGRSVVYHQHRDDGTGCNAGVATLAENLFDKVGDTDAEPCFRCHPTAVEDIPLDMMIDMEKDRYSVHVCADAAAVIEKLRNKKNATAHTPGTISGPGQRLLDIAVGIDPSMMNSATVIDRI
jgi:hypothetical protein